MLRNEITKTIDADIIEINNNKFLLQSLYNLTIRDDLKKL